MTDATDQDTSIESPDLLLACAIRAIEEHGEAGLRVEEVARQAGVAVSAIYHRYGSRQALVEAAQEQRLREVWGTTVIGDIERMRIMADGAMDREHLRELLAIYSPEVGGDQRADGRLQRLMIIGSAIHQPSLRAAIATYYQDYLDTAADALRTTMDRGLMRTDLDPRLCAAWLHVNMFGRVVDEVHPLPMVLERTNALRHQALRWMFFDDFDQSGYGEVLPPPSAPSAPTTATATTAMAATTAMTATDPSDDELHATGRRILKRVIEQIDQEGEASVRLRRIAQSEHVSETVIHRHFGNREGLVTAAHAERVRLAAPYEPERFVQAALACETAEEFRTVLTLSLRIRLGAAAEPQRLRRVNAIAGCHGRPALAEQTGTILHSEATRFAEGIEHARRRGWTDPDVDSLALGHWMTGMEVSQVLFEIDDLEFDRDAWRNMVVEFCLRSLNS